MPVRGFIVHRGHEYVVESESRPDAPAVKVYR